MADFSVIVQSPSIQALVQENALERQFHDSLAPRILFRSEAEPFEWPAGSGETQIFTAPGLIPIDATPNVAGQDPVPVTYAVEQWVAELQQYSSSIDTNMPTSMLAIASLFLQNTHQSAIQAGMTVNRVVRNRMYAAALCGWGVADGAQGPTTSLRVVRLNGLTTARNPILLGASKVRFEGVSSSNPLEVTIDESGTPATRNIIGFTADIPGDVYGPGIIVLDSAVTVLDGAYVMSVDRTALTRVGGGNSVRNLTPGTDIPTLADVRTTLAEFQQQNVPTHADGMYHCHLDPTSQALIFADDEFQRLFTSLPDMYTYSKFALGKLLGTAFILNSECPQPSTIVGGGTYTLKDPFPGEVYINKTPASGVVHRMLFTAQGGIMEYYADQSQLLTEAGLNGKVGNAHVVNNGIEIITDRIQLIIRAPLNRLQDQVATSWRIIADWPARTDAATGTVARYKRFAVVEHAA